MNADMLRALYAYHFSLHRRVWECIDHLTDEQFVAPVEYSIGSVRNHMVHLASVEERWLARIAGSPVPERLVYEDYPTRAAARARWEEVEAHFKSFLDGLSDDDLSRTITYTITRRAEPVSNALWEILLHVVNHGTDHRAQVLPILHRAGAPTLEQDYMVYLWEKND
ncbi:MAG TPA: DinB family protein [Aggregatilineaceae bacterium]|jgi:uncharacterized damage-inducible protein DinB|nr:DinB family protein [Aggregatilineaceae bacterium]